MPNEGDNVPPTNFQRLDSGVRTRGSEIKERGKETAKKAEKEKKTESNWNKFAAIAYRRSYSVRNLSKYYMTMFRLEYRDNQCLGFHHLHIPLVAFLYQQPSLLISETNILQRWKWTNCYQYVHFQMTGQL